MRLLVTACIAVLANSPIRAQELRMAWHDDQTIQSGVRTGGRPLAYRLTASSALRVVAAQVHTGGIRGAAELRLLAHDGDTGLPGRALGASIEFEQRTARSWQGGTLPEPIELGAGDVFWLEWSAPAGSFVNWSRAEGGTTRYVGRSDDGWSGPRDGFGPVAAQIRLYGAGAPAATASFGDAKPGAGGVAPTVRLSGWPARGNPFELILESAPPGTAAWLIGGDRTERPLPGFGTLYATPLIVAEVHTGDGAGAGTGTGAVEIRVPRDLSAASAAFQFWVRDPDAKDGVAHTDGLEVRLR